MKLLDFKIVWIFLKHSVQTEIIVPSNPNTVRWRMSHFQLRWRVKNDKIQANIETDTMAVFK